jgi:hypothetical protein
VSSKQTIRIQFADVTLVADAQALAAEMWRHMPPMIADPTSPEAQQNSTARIAIKAAAKSLGPMLLKHMLGHEERQPKGDDALVWFTQVMIASVVAGMASQEWTLDVQQDSESGVYTFGGITPGTTNAHAPQLAAAD